MVEKAIHALESFGSCISSNYGTPISDSDYFCLPEGMKVPLFPVIPIIYSEERSKNQKEG